MGGALKAGKGGKSVKVREKYDSIVEMFSTTLSDVEKIEKETVRRANF